MTNDNIIVVTQRIDYLPDRNETRDSLDKALITLLRDLGFVVVPVPNVDLDHLEEFLHLVNPSAICLSGGNDIGQYETRDNLEKYLVQLSIRSVIPLFGICRGMQLIASCFGANLEGCTNHLKHNHLLHCSAATESFASSSPVLVNSFHTQKVSSLPKELLVTAHAPDGVIEAIKHLSLPIEACMWHPERSPGTTPQQMSYLRRFFEQTSLV